MPTPEEPHPRPARTGRSALGAVEFACILAAALLALWFHLTLPARRPAPADDEALASLLRKEMRPGDAVLLLPWWTERLRLFAPDGLSVHGWPGVEHADFVEHPRLWLVSQPRLPRAGAEEARFLAAFEKHRVPLGPPRRVGHYDVRLFENQRAAAVRFSAVDALDEAMAWLEGPGESRTECVRLGAAFRCNGPSPLEISAGWHELLYRPVRCLMMPPAGGTGVTVAEFKNVPAGTLLLEAGIIWEHAWRREPPLTPVHVRVRAQPSSEALAGLIVPPGREGSLSAQTRLDAPTDLRVEVTSENAESRALCLNLRILTALEEKGGPKP